MPADSTPQPLVALLATALADRYRIEREIGAGGTATVYLADDVKHRRKVAVKVLRPDVAVSVGPERFFREIEVAAQLQHPHILPLHDSGKAHGFLYYVMPYVEGDSLRQRLATKGEFPIPDALRILTEVTDALAYAHARGIVHRDMKPDNIMFSGRHALVLDFGIAKAVSLATVTTEPHTGGLALGTPAYMAPEQAMADPNVDHRADIYAVGVIAYELLSGHPPFSGMPAAEIMTAQVTRAPVPIATRRRSVPPALAALVMRCLEKRPADRPQDAHELLATLVALATPSGGLEPTGARPAPSSIIMTRLRRWKWAAGGITLAAAVVALGLWGARKAASRAPDWRLSQVTFTGTATDPDISPDGRWVAYLERGDTNRLVVKDLASGSTARIADADPARWRPARWSRDGSWLLRTFTTPAGGPGAELIPRLGGDARPLPSVGYPALSPDGSTLAVWNGPPDSPIELMTLASGTVRSVVVPEKLGWHEDLEWSPDQRSLALITAQESGSSWALWSYDVLGARWRAMVEDSLTLSSPRWSPRQDAIYYLRGKFVGETELRVVRLGSNGSPRGGPEVLQRGLGADRNDGIPSMSLSADATRLVYAKGLGRQNVWLARRATERAPFTITQVTLGTAPKSSAALSPDGGAIAFIQGEDERADVYVVGVGGGTPRRVTSHGRVAWGSVAWSPDGQRLAYGLVGDGGARVSTIALDGRGERSYEHAAVGLGSTLVWAPQEKIAHAPPGDRNIRLLDPATERETALVGNDSVGRMFWPASSPDGRFVSVTWHRPPEGTNAYILSTDDTLRRRIGPESARPLGWSVDSRFVYLIGPKGQIWRVSRDGERQARVGTVPFSDPDHPDCSARERGAGLILLCVVDEVPVTDIWMLENFDPKLRPRR